ncbi:MAG: hypothetical protein CBD27_09570 [Rhodospirillaceae bacterium TMED167]|nr:hypothetical protein [Rhodospirillaceae bacterium]OUW25408.1 MAG: hypothetical protein CBD27_09570 [Rhodospirillaceae bacterium TMED167]
MRYLKSPLLLTAVMLLVSACGATFDYDSLESKKITGTRFSDQLARAYQSFALSEAHDMNDWIDAAHFGSKSLAALKQELVSPEHVEDWWIRGEARELLMRERLRLTSLLGPEVQRQSPKAAAMAQAGFDCWVEQQEENWQYDHIEACRTQYFTAVAQLERQLGLIQADSAARQVMPVMQIGAPFPRRRAHREVILSFDFDSARISGAGNLKIFEIVEMYEQGLPVTIVVSGHADRAGPATYNETLSQRRAETVRKKLIEAGVPVQLITAIFHGERRPLIETENGVREPLNRRVKITLDHAKSL